MDTETLYKVLDQRSDEVAGQVVAWRHHLHAHPKLSNREKNTAACPASG